MTHELNLPPDIENRLVAHAKETGQDVVYLIQMAVSRFVEEEVPASDDADWNEELNTRRCQLIDKDLAGDITVEERIELISLQKRAEQYRDQVAPPPLQDAEAIYNELLTRSNSANGNQ